MKSPIVFFILVCTMLTGVFAQQSSEGVAIDVNGLTVAFHSNPQGADVKLLPFVDGRSMTGSKERFGLFVGGANPPAGVIEILGKDAAVQMSLSLADLFRGKGKGFSVIPPRTANSQRWIENRYALDIPQQNVELVMKALSTGSTPADEQLTVSFALRSETAAKFGLRLSLPAVGILEAKSGGLILASKSGTAAIAAAVYPGSASVTTSKSTATLTSPPVSLDASKESTLLWVVLEAVPGGGASGNARILAANILHEKRFGERDPRIVIASNPDKVTTQPGDIVTYSLVCRNIGTGDATDVTLSNPVSQGLQYVEGSATSDESTVSFDQKGGSAIRNINWKFHNPIRPGEERLVCFKVKVL